MKWIDGLPYYEWDELVKILDKIPPSPPGHLTHFGLSWHEHMMYYNMGAFLNYLGMYFENCATSLNRLDLAKNRLKSSITHNIDYIKIKHCKS